MKKSKRPVIIVDWTKLAYAAVGLIAAISFLVYAFISLKG